MGIFYEHDLNQKYDAVDKALLEYNTAFKEELDTKEGRINDLESELNDVYSERDTLKQQVEITHEENNELLEKIEALEVQISFLKNQTDTKELNKHLEKM